MSRSSLELLISNAEQKLASSGITSARLDAELLLAHVLNKPRTWVHAHIADKPTPAEADAFTGLIQRRANREPLVHLTGSREFYGIDFAITPDVLTPRVETEQMVEWAIKYAPTASKLIDIGTGSGAIAAGIAVHRPDLTITATDITSRELTVAKTNFENLNLGIALIESDLWQNVSGQFETIVTNLPYLPDNADLMPEVKKEPAVALFGGPDGLGLYRKFLDQLPHFLVRGGFLFTECDPWQHEQLIAEAAEVGLTPIEQGYFILGFKLER